MASSTGVTGSFPACGYGKISTTTVSQSLQSYIRCRNSAWNRFRLITKNHVVRIDRGMSLDIARKYMAQVTETWDVGRTM